LTLKAAGVSQPLFDETARQGMYQATKGIPRKVNKLAMTALRLAAASKSQTVNEAILLDATACCERGCAIAGAVTRRATGLTAAWLDRAGTIAAARHPVRGR
jgi:hypothetical protein